MDNRDQDSGENSHRKIVFVGGLDDSIDETLLHAAFTPFGDIVSVYLPRGNVNKSTTPMQANPYPSLSGEEKEKENSTNLKIENGMDLKDKTTTSTMSASAIANANGVKGYAFVTFTQEEYALAAVDNMEASELNGRILTVNIAKPMKHKLGNSKAVWSTEEYLLENVQNEELELALAEEEEFGKGDG